MINNDMSWYLILFSALIVNNILLIRFIALCSFFGVGGRLETAIGMGMAVMFVMIITSAVTWVVWHYLLVPLNLEFLRTGTFILVIAALVQFEEMYLRRTLPSLYYAMGIYLPLITTNCAILAVAFLHVDYGLGFLKTIIYTIGVSGGYTLAIILFAGIRERMELSPIPRSFSGYAITFITAALMSLAFLGFSHIFGL